VKRWVAPAIYGALAVEVTLIVGFAATYNALDFFIYTLGGRAVTQDTHLYLDQLAAHWFTNTPFAAVLFSPIAAIPLTIARVIWELASVVAFASACMTTLKLAGYRASRTVVVAAVVMGLLLEPVWHSLFLGQINLFLLALVLTDISRVSRGRPAGIGIGIAAAIKLTPAIFIILLLITRRTRAALTAGGTFVLCGLLAYLIAPGASRLYWLHLFHDTTRVGAPTSATNPPYGAVLRICGGVTHAGASVFPGCRSRSGSRGWQWRPHWPEATTGWPRQRRPVRPACWSHRSPGRITGYGSCRPSSCSCGMGRASGSPRYRGTCSLSWPRCGGHPVPVDHANTGFTGG
jgi:Predicted integral membrane protein